MGKSQHWAEKKYITVDWERNGVKAGREILHRKVGKDPRCANRPIDGGTGTGIATMKCACDGLLYELAQYPRSFAMNLIFRGFCSFPFPQW